MKVLLNDVIRLANRIQNRLGTNARTDCTVDNMIGYNGQQVDSLEFIDLDITEVEYIFLTLKYL